MAGVERNGRMLLTVRVHEVQGRGFIIDVNDTQLSLCGTEEEGRIRANWYLEGFARGYDEAKAEKEEVKPKKPTAKRKTSTRRKK